MSLDEFFNSLGDNLGARWSWGLSMRNALDQSCRFELFWLDEPPLTADDRRRLERTSFLVAPEPPRKCSACAATGLDVFYTSRRDGRTLCEACFQQREAKQLAKVSDGSDAESEAGARRPEKARPARGPRIPRPSVRHRKPHPLDLL